MSHNSAVVVFFYATSQPLSFYINKAFSHICFLIDERDNPFPHAHGDAKLLVVALVNGSGAWHEVCRRPYYEEPSGRYRGEEGETCPFHQFAKIVGRGDIAVKTLGGQIVVGVAGRAKMANYVVGVKVDAHA